MAEILVNYVMPVPVPARPWTFEELRAALVATGLPTVLLDKSKALFRGFAETTGTTGELIPAFDRLKDYEPPSGSPTAAVTFVCAVQSALLDPAQYHPGQLSIEALPGSDVPGVVASLGSLDASTRYADNPLTTVESWSLQGDAATVVQRCIAYLRNASVLYAMPAAIATA